jgi:hypothetical protein
MSLSHLDPLEQLFWQIHPGFIPRPYEGAMDAVPWSLRAPRLLLNSPVKNRPRCNFPVNGAFNKHMKRMFSVGIAALSALGWTAYAQAQPPAPEPMDGQPPAVISANPDLNPVPIEWVPPALSRLSAQAPVKSSFTLDRDMLTAAAGLVPDSDAPAKQAIAKLDGVSVHTMRFGEPGLTDFADVDAVREAYHLRGWKHLVSATNSGGPVHDGTTDVWVVVDGVNLRGAVVLAQTPKSLTLVTVDGNISSVDLLHLRGHFGIPRFDGDNIRDAK